MKIAEVSCHVVGTEIKAQYRADLPPMEWQCVVTRVRTDDGVEGCSQQLNFNAADGLADVIVNYFASFVLGEDPRYTERIWQKVWAANRLGFSSILAQGAIDTAVWDLAGKVAGVPIWQMLGGYRDKVRAYASTATLENVDAYVSLAKDLIQEGYTAIKLHAWGEPRKDVEACEAVRDVVGPSIDLMLDPVGAYDRADALRVGRELERLNFYWYEEPLLDHDLAGYADLARALDIPIAAAETLGGGLYDYPAFIAQNAVDIIRPDAGLMRGITPMKKAAGLAEAFNMKCEPHTYGFPMMQAANLHVVCSMRNCEFFEVPVPTGMLDRFVDAKIEVDRDGFVHVPDRPGIGILLDEDELDKATKGVKTARL